MIGQVILMATNTCEPRVSAAVSFCVHAAVRCGASTVLAIAAALSQPTPETPAHAFPRESLPGRPPPDLRPPASNVGMAPHFPDIVKCPESVGFPAGGSRPAILICHLRFDPCYVSNQTDPPRKSCFNDGTPSSVCLSHPDVLSERQTFNRNGGANLRRHRGIVAGTSSRPSNAAFAPAGLLATLRRRIAAAVRIPCIRPDLTNHYVHT